MRLVTRSDFDGLACGALLKEAGIIDSWKFAHPKDLQDGLVPVDENDCLANVPFVEGCGLWFDHHSSEHERNELKGKYKGESRITPSCARIIYEYYGGRERFPQFDDMMEAVDKVDSGSLTIDEVMNPKGWILIGFLMDPRTGLATFPPVHHLQLSAYGEAHGCMPHHVHRRDSLLSLMFRSELKYTMSRQRNLRRWLRSTHALRAMSSSRIYAVLTLSTQATVS